MTRRPLVCAHRGASARLPDNSMPAFVEAIAAGADVIETDVRRSADGRLVLAHDTWDLERDDLVDLDALIELAHGRVGLDLEIVDVGLERDVLDAVDGFAGWLTVTSSYPDVLAEMARLSRHVHTGLVVEAPYAGHPFEHHRLLHDPIGLADECDAGALLIEDELATPQLLDRLRGSDRLFWVWTVNDAPRLRQLLADETVTGVITDEPALACALRDEVLARDGATSAR